MATSSSSRGRSNDRVLRPLTSTSSKFCSYATSNAPFKSSSGFPSPSSSTFFNNHRSTSPTRVNLGSSTALSSSVRFAIDNRSNSPNRSVTSHVIASKNNRHQHHHGHHTIQKRTCMCSPTTHPGSFRCSLHKNSGNGNSSNQNSDSYLPNRLNMRRSAMKNSIVRIGGVEGDWVKRALTALIRPSSHQQRRRAAFNPRPSRLSVMSSAAAEEDL